MKDNDLKPEESVSKKDLAVVEAALYVAGRPLGLKTLKNILGLRSKKRIMQIARKLIQIYQGYNSAIEILEVKNSRFVMQLKADYSHKVRKVSSQPNLTRGPLRTLSYIALNQPVYQRDLIAVRGNHVYRHLKQLEQKRLIERKGTGQKKIIKTTTIFADYFGLSHDSRAFKRQIKSLFKQ